MGARLPALQGKHTGLAQIVNMQKSPQRCASDPAGHTCAMGLGHLMKATDQGQQQMAVFGVAVVARP
jgi:hypothetical protein